MSFKRHHASSLWCLFMCGGVFGGGGVVGLRAEGTVPPCCSLNAPLRASPLLSCPPLQYVSTEIRA